LAHQRLGWIPAADEQQQQFPLKVPIAPEERMNKHKLGCAMILLTLGIAGPVMSAGRQGSDETEIRRVELGLQDAWNSHDRKAWANFFTEDADFVNDSGLWWKGRAEIEKKHADAHASLFRDSKLTIYEVETRFLTPEIAISHAVWSLVGQKNPDGTPGQPRKGVFTHVLQKQNGTWLIAAAQNTDSGPEVTPPLGPTNK
jgi:uncharacterized protein (TIGR02246 family)